jgi:glycosyltransferase involved in cell wall biosynthesis
MRRLLLLSLNHDPLGNMGETHVGGQAKYVLEVAKNLALRGWSTVIYTVGGRGYPEQVAIAANCQLVRIERESGRPYAYDIGAEEARRIGEEILIHAVERQWTFEIAYACFWISGLAARPVASFLNIPTVFSFCQLGAFKAQADGLSAVAERIEHEKAVCNAASAIIATNRDEIASIREVYAVPRHKIHFIPRGIDLQTFFA